ncbi:hypothetical protein J4429_02070 [Candidatus Pacearchaeota archaeon]|nr:hypothetical protein [Candidatus Pacearchaeota archaeon]
MVTIEYRKELEKLREFVGSFGKVDWSDESDKRLAKPYRELVDIFGETLDSREKSKLVRIMCENSGFSDDWEMYGFRLPITLGMFSGFKIEVASNLPRFNSPVAAMVYFKETESETFYHEGVHFLSKYGYKSFRLIRRDVPLAKVIGTFFRLLDNPKKEFKYLTGENFCVIP